MKSLKTTSAVFAATMAVLFAAQATQARPAARSLRQVQSVWVDSNSCQADISNRLEERGFFVANRPSAADAVLEVDVDRRPSVRARSLDNSADYQAKLRGDNDFVIFSASGTKYARTYSDICEGIGDSIAQSMSEMG